MEVLVNNKLVRLTDQDFLSGGQGGQGKVYVKNNLAYKIYTDKKYRGQLDKINELSVLDKAFICKPLNIVENKRREGIGFVMDYVAGGIPLCKFFTSIYWQRQNIKIKDIMKIVEQIREGIEYIHGKNILLVDINEFNFLVMPQGEPFFIDVDSYQTPSHPATAIMPHIRDYHSKVFSRLTDWYSFAVIACQLFVGIHPFKGKHPDYSRKDLIKRMRDNVSIFGPKVSVPSAARDFSHIPKAYKDWFVSLFAYGERTAPPSLRGVRIVITEAKKTEVKGDFEVKYICEFIEEEERFYMGSKIRSMNGVDFIYKSDCLTELYISAPFGKDIMAAVQAWSVMPHATQVMDGVICQNMLGRKHLSFFYKNGRGKTCCSILHVPELDSYRVVEGRQEKGVCVVIGYQKGQYDEFILKFNPEYSKYSLQKTEGIDYVGINFTVLDNGTAVTFEDGCVRVFSNRMDSDKVKVIRNDSTNPGMRVCSDGSQVRYVEDTRLYSIKVK